MEGNNNFLLNHNSETINNSLPTASQAVSPRSVSVRRSSTEYLFSSLPIYLLGVLTAILLHGSLIRPLAGVTFSTDFWSLWFVELILVMPYFCLLASSVSILFWMPAFLLSGFVNGFFSCMCQSGASLSVAAVVLCRTLPLFGFWALRLSPSRERSRQLASGLFLLLFSTLLCAWMKYLCFSVC
ncbi:MAG: hypothetical protein VB055_01645 [Oscillospiraceae bacterium]|nr:hypothetical protein [Oscillospiraceae bacterium]